MKIGVPTEIKNNEFRVALTPNSVKSLTDKNHNLFVQSGAGNAIGFSDENYTKSGATILDTAQEIYANSELIVKV
jgi:alanine dehydrogenase